MIQTFINIDSLFERTAGDIELVEELCNLLEEELFNYQAEIFNSLEQLNYDNLAAQTHKLKSAVGVLGFDNVAILVQSVEKNALKKNQDFDYENKINVIFISLTNHIFELKNLIKNKLWEY